MILVPAGHRKKTLEFGLANDGFLSFFAEMAQTPKVTFDFFW